MSVSAAAGLNELAGPVTKITASKKVFVYGMADRKVGGIELQTPDGNIPPVYPAELKKNLPEPFKSEPDGQDLVR